MQNRNRKKKNRNRRELSSGVVTTHLYLVAAVDGENDAGAGAQDDQTKQSGGGRSEPGTQRAAVPQIERERDEIGTRGSRRRVAEEARVLNLPLLSNGGHRLLLVSAW